MKQFLKWFLLFYRIALALVLLVGTVSLIWWTMQLLGRNLVKPFLEWLALLYPPYSNFLVAGALLFLLIGGGTWAICSEMASNRKSRQLRIAQEAQDARDRAAAAELFPQLPQMYPHAGFQPDENGNLFLPFHAQAQGLFWYQNQWAAITIGIDEDAQHIFLSDKDDSPLEEQVRSILKGIMTGQLVLVTAEDEEGYLQHTDICSPAEAQRHLAEWGKPPEPLSLFSRSFHLLFLLAPQEPHRISVGRIFTWDGSGNKTVYFD